ncbi:hypothetical protein TL16_g07012 [Triparma laevis f. inornata]|uniref:Uncharacterized protein n=2 Tax=Triparma laevis TaxID=1534972 RepID=A0A9W7FUS4_9STRA|nr:hypothetical protein TL16_g07012 [Triparma laevis f. inornata]GMI18732.1 hypothetical protein TrLO_g4598 [Triparma laevis f. longispina]
MVMSRQDPSSGTRLVASSDLNGAARTRAMLDCCIAVPKCCSGPVFLACCLLQLDTRYGLEGQSNEAGYILKGHTFVKGQCKLRGLPDGAVIMFGDTNLGKRRDMVVALANYIGKVAAMPNSA